MADFNGARGRIADEHFVMRALIAEGYTGTVETLRTLAKLGKRLRTRYENACSYEWACTDKYDAGTERAEKRIAEIAAAAGLKLYLQTDPRGAPVYVCGPTGEMTDRNYSTRGQCLYFDR